MKKFTVDCHTGPRSRTRPRGTSLISQRNSFRPFEMRMFAEGTAVATGPGLMARRGRCGGRTRLGDPVHRSAYSDWRGLHRLEDIRHPRFPRVRSAEEPPGSLARLSPLCREVARRRQSPMRGVSTLPCTRLDEPRCTLFTPFKFPSTVPSTTISLASISACTLPWDQPLRGRPPRRIFPCASPSIYRSDFPDNSPRIFRPAPILDARR